MKIFDCFMYFDEEMILDLRLNILNGHVDYFIIVESRYNHKGERRKLLFNKEKFIKYRDKIIYLVHDEVPSKVKIINETQIIKYDFFLIIHLFCLVVHYFYHTLSCIFSPFSRIFFF